MIRCSMWWSHTKQNLWAWIIRVSRNIYNRVQVQVRVLQTLTLYPVVTLGHGTSKQHFIQKFGIEVITGLTKHIYVRDYNFIVQSSQIQDVKTKCNSYLSQKVTIFDHGEQLLLYVKNFATGCSWMQKLTQFVKFSTRHVLKIPYTIPLALFINLH